jgi:signal transduction histidine kinase
MFAIAFAFGAFAFLPKMFIELQHTWIGQSLEDWSIFPIISAVTIAVYTSFLNKESFDKPFQLFTAILLLTALLIVIPLQIKGLIPWIYRAISALVSIPLAYMVFTKKRLPDILFMLSVVCFVAGGVGLGFKLAVEFSAFAFTFAYIFIFLVFLTSEGSEGIASFFILKKELERTKQKLTARARYSEHLEELVEAKKKELEQAKRLAAIGETAAMVGHDLRNPLQAIINRLYLVKRKTSLSKDVVDYMDDIEKETFYMNKIVSDLQDYGRLRKLNLGMHDLRILTEETLSIVEVPENIKVSLEIKNGFRLWVDIDLMKRVLTNLVKNALQAMPKGDSLRIRGLRLKDMAYISIIDVGQGISEETLPKLFQPLFTTKAQGQGLGLAVCKRIVEAHKGSIEVQSVEGKGSTFTVKIPFKKEELLVVK